MKIYNHIVAFLFLTAAVFASGCACCKQSTTGAPQHSNVLGVVETRTKSFAPPASTTFDLSTAELFARANPSGTQTKLLFGLITVADY